MFVSLNALLGTVANLTISLTRNTDDTITATVIPHAKKDGKEGNPASLNTPLTLTGTAEELDAEFAAIVSNYSGKRLSLTEQLEATTAIMDAAKQESAAAATKAIKKNVKATPAAAARSESDPEDGEHDESDDDKVAPSAPAEAKAAEVGAQKLPAAADDNLFS